MTWTPYGSPPASMQSKAWRTMTPQEAYERATPDQRRRWFGNERPVKSVGTTPPHDPGEDLALQRAIASGQEAQRLGYGYDDPVNGNVCAQCRSAAPTETKGGRCRHRPGRAELVQQRDWQRRPSRTPCSSRPSSTAALAPRPWSWTGLGRPRSSRLRPRSWPSWRRSKAPAASTTTRPGMDDRTTWGSRGWPPRAAGRLPGGPAPSVRGVRRRSPARAG
jgi:hypothetical protein